MARVLRGTTLAWVALFPLSTGAVEPIDTGSAALAVLFTGGTTLFVARLDLPLLEVGWGVLTGSFLLRLLDELAEGPEALESLLPGTVRLVALGCIFLGFVRTTTRLRSSLSEHDERLDVLNRFLRHNLRNELTVVIGALEHASERLPENDTVARGLASARELADLGEEIRDVDAVLAEGEGPPERTDVNAAVEAVVQRVGESYPAVDVAVDAAPGTPMAAANGLEAAIEQVVENACAHNDAADPAVTVEVAADAQRVAVTVRDNGPGIPEHELAAIRERRESALEHGSGVGLWVVHWIVERAGGTVTFDSDGGQTVTLWVPRADSPGLLGRLPRRG